MPKRVFKQKGSRVYRLRYRVDGDSREYDVPLKTTNKEVAEAKARVIVEEKEKELAGLLDPKPLRDAAKKPIAEHLADYVADLQARGNGKDHIVHTRQRMRRLIADCHWQLLHDVSADSFAKWLRGQQAQRSAKTLNEYLGHLKAFFNWLERQDRIAQNRIGRIPRLDARGKETFKRRPLEVEQFLLLIKYSEKRRFAYALAALTGLRRGELKRLLWADVHLDAPRPWMEIRGATTKNKQPATIFPVPLLIELLKAHWGDGTGLVLLRITACTCTRFAPADFDQDCDVDAADSHLLELCWTGPNIPYDPDHLPAGCTLTPGSDRTIAADLDHDGDVDQSDFGILQRCYSGSGNPADPNCNQ